MTTKPKFKSGDVFAAIHASAIALQKVGAMNQTMMRKFDMSCLAAPIALEPKQIKRRSSASSLGNWQSIFK